MRKKLSYEWAHYELAMLFLKELSPEKLDKVIKSFPYESLSALEAHYIANMCFLKDDYIIKNARKISGDTPITIVQGRYDVVCPPVMAWRLAKALPRAKLHFVTAGHASCEPEIRKMLIAETDMMYYSVK
jgi:proline iminopeptidase